MEWIDAKTIYTILHIFGAVIGAGGAYVSDAMFFASVKDRVISDVELRFMRIGSMFVWIGLGILLVSGLLLFSTNVAGYLASSKFLIKMLIVGVITVNGIVFHIFHFPRLYRHVGKHYPSSEEFMRYKKLLIVSGVISITSWTFALILGGLRMIPWTFTEALVAYVCFEAVAIIGALIFTRRIM